MQYSIDRARFSWLSATAISIGVLTTFFVVQFFCVHLAAKLWYVGDFGTLVGLGSADGRVVAVSIMLSAVLMMGLAWLIAWTKLRKPTDIKRFFGWYSFTAKPLLVGVGLLLAFNVVGEGLGRYFNQDPMVFMDALISPESLWYMLMATVIIAPIYEEVIFRGLIFGMFADATIKSRWGVALTSVITSVLFAVIHLQYNWFGMALIFVMALIFAYVRVAGSLLLAIALHVLNNAIAMGLYLLGV